MDSANTQHAPSTQAGSSKRGTPNKRWKAEYDNFLIPVLVEQAKKGLKCDKSFKRVAFQFAATAVNSRFDTDYTAENVENHYKTLKARYNEIKKAKDLSGAGWNEELKMITLDPVVAKTYTEAHPAAKNFINKPIDNYEGLRIICGEDNATGSSAMPIYSEFAEKSENDRMNLENMDTLPVDEHSDEGGDAQSAPPVSRTPVTSSTRSQRRTRRSKSPPMMAELVTVVAEMASAIKNPTH